MVNLTFYSFDEVLPNHGEKVYVGKFRTDFFYFRTVPTRIEYVWMVYDLEGDFTGSMLDYEDDLVMPDFTEFEKENEVEMRLEVIVGDEIVQDRSKFFWCYPDEFQYEMAQVATTKK